MPKINLYVSNELKDRMNKAGADGQWSQIARVAFEKFLAGDVAELEANIATAAVTKALGRNPIGSWRPSKRRWVVKKNGTGQR